MKSILPLTLEKISLEIGGKFILKDINMNIFKGQPKIILGPNGAGKSTLMKICHGLIKPSTGKVIWSNYSQKYCAKRQAMVFQRPVMLRRTVEKNLLYVINFSDSNNNDKYKLVSDALKLVGMEKFENYPARELSQGEQQKLALARAWLLKPEMLFLDEPTSNLDPESTDKVEKIINTISSNGTQILMTTHNIAQAERIGNEIFFMDNGKIIEQSKSETFFLKPVSYQAKKFISNEKLKY